MLICIYLPLVAVSWSKFANCKRRKLSFVWRVSFVVVVVNHYVCLWGEVEQTNGNSDCLGRQIPQIDSQVKSKHWRLNSIQTFSKYLQGYIFPHLNLRPSLLVCLEAYEKWNTSFALREVIEIINIISLLFGQYWLSCVVI